MKKIFFTSLILLALPLSLFANSAIINIKISKPDNGQVAITWSTNEPSTSYVFFGYSPDHMPFYVGNNQYKQAHQADLTGLRKDTDYYYKIMITNQNGQVTESYTNYFNTKDMSLNQSLVIKNFNKEQAIDKAVAFSFTTSRKAKVLVEYGSNNSLNKSWRNNSYQTQQQIIIKGLEPGTSYNFKITASDEDNNSANYSFRVNTSSANFNELRLENLKPSYYGQYPVFSDKAIISFSSNILSTADIYYGTKADSLNKRVRISDVPSLEHYLNLENLTANTTYYYKIVLSSALNNAKHTSLVFSFKTKEISPESIKESARVSYRNGDLVVIGKNTYVLYDDSKFRVQYSPLIAKQEVKTISQLELDSFKEESSYFGPYHEGQILRVEGDRLVYLISNNTRRPLASWDVFYSLNYSSSEIVYVSKQDLNRYPLGRVVNKAEDISLNRRINNRVVTSPNSSTVYLLVNDKKLPFLSAQSFSNKGYNFSQVINIADSELNKYQIGTPLF